ncbi:MAG: FIST C-terminal domain-containing protein [Proteobacteria bacterium]|nr:FIST C-terminal domain-containing protein [Pseudomonadota bacterium]
MSARAVKQKTSKPVATGLSHGDRPYPEHAERAVKQALERAGLERANSVLLFLTPEYATDPDPAIRAAARAAGTMQVIGCTGAGVLTEDEWILDSPGAAAMIFGGESRLNKTPENYADDEPVLSLCTPAGMVAEWLDIPGPRMGAVSGDVIGQGPFKVWNDSRVCDSGVADALIQGAHGVVLGSQGVHALTAPIEVVEVQGRDVVRMGNYPALNVLVQSLPEQVQQLHNLPYHLLAGGVTFGDPDNAIREGRYRLNHIISANSQEQSITLSEPLHPGERLFWAMRDALSAERAMAQTIDMARAELRNEPDFAFLFPCMGRGPNFYGNRDRDLELVKARFPDTPVIGFYGNGEIAPLDGINHLYQYSAILGLYQLT